MGRPRCLRLRDLRHGRCPGASRFPFVTAAVTLLAPGGSVHQIPRPADAAPLAVRRSWAGLIRKVYEVDPLTCPRCGGPMKVIAVIERPTIIRQILDHLGLLSPAGPRSPPDDRAASEGLAAGGQPREWRYEPLFDDLPIADPLELGDVVAFVN